MYKVEWASTAVLDLEQIITHISNESPLNAAAILDKIEAVALTLASHPLRGRYVPELAACRVRIYRELLVTPWRLMYRVSGKTVFVLAVLDSRRSVEDLLLDRILNLK